VFKKEKSRVERIKSKELEEVLQREIQGLKVYPFYRSLVFSMTGTYF